MSLMKKLERDTLQRQCKKEVEELHQLFVAWFQGIRPKDILEQELKDRLQYAFSHVAPNGQFLLGRKVLIKHLQDKYACYKERVFQIDIYNVQLLWNDEHGRCLCTYEEWQSWKQTMDPASTTASETTEADGGTKDENVEGSGDDAAAAAAAVSSNGGNVAAEAGAESTSKESLVQFGRLSTCLLERQDNRLTWVHVHETWLEAESPPDMSNKQQHTSLTAASVTGMEQQQELQQQQEDVSPEEEYGMVVSSVKDDSNASVATGPIEASATRSAVVSRSNSKGSLGGDDDGGKDEADVTPRLIILMSSQTLSREQVTHQQNALTILQALNIAYTEVDGTDYKQHESREELFTISGIRGMYPQFFICNPEQDSTITYWGDWNKLESSNDNGALKSEILGDVGDEEEENEDATSPEEEDEEAAPETLAAAAAAATAAPPSPKPGPSMPSPKPLTPVQRRPTTFPLHQDLDDGGVAHLVLMLSSQNMSKEQVSHQSRVMVFLKVNKIPYIEVDGTDYKQHDTKEMLFDVAPKDKRGIYPQFFVLQHGRVKYWGDWNVFKSANDKNTLKDDLEQALKDGVSETDGTDIGDALAMAAVADAADAIAAASKEEEEEEDAEPPNEKAATTSEADDMPDEKKAIENGNKSDEEKGENYDKNTNKHDASAAALSKKERRRSLSDMIEVPNAPPSWTLSSLATASIAPSVEGEKSAAAASTTNDTGGNENLDTAAAAAAVTIDEETHENGEGGEEEDEEGSYEEEGEVGEGILEFEPEDEEESKDVGEESKSPAKKETEMTPDERAFMEASQGILFFEEDEDEEEEGEKEAASSGASKTKLGEMGGSELLGAIDELEVESPIPQDASSKRHLSPKLFKYAQPLKWENALVGISIAGFDIGTSQGPMGDESWFKQTGDALEEISQSRSIPRPRRKICLPEMVFPTAHVALEGHGLWMSWDALDALEEWARCHHEIAIHSRISCNGVSVMRAKDAKLWDQKRKHGQETQGVSSVFHYDWTFSTPFTGKVEGGTWNPLDESGMRLSLLTDQSVPILFYDEILLYEDDLHDNGQVQYVVKLRVMPSCAYVLARLWLRVDHVMVRVRETRVLIDFFGMSPQIYRDVCWRECMWGELAANKLPTDVKDWCSDGRETPAWNELLRSLPECSLPKDIPKHAVLQREVDNEASAAPPA